MTRPKLRAVSPPKPKETPMTEKERMLMLRILDGRPDLTPVVYHLWHYRRSEQIFKYLIQAGLTGAKLAVFMLQECKGTPMNLAKEVLRRIDREAGVKAVMVGRDFLT